MKNTLKTILTLSLVALITLSFTACGNNNSKNNSDTDSATTANSLSSTSSTETNDSVKLSKFQQFEKGLTEKQIEYEVNDKMASMVGAKEGYGYVFSDETAVELYLFDKNSDAYKEAIKENKITLESFDMTMDVIFNDDICVYYNGEPSNKSDIQTIFENLK